MASVLFHFNETSHLNDGEIRLRLLETQQENYAAEALPTYRFSIIRNRDEMEVGACDLRIGFNESVFYSGNVGYRIYEPFRGNHYALKACKLLLILAKEHRMPQVVITCRPENIASRRTCELLEAKLMGIARLPTFHFLYQQGEREECRYVINFDEFR